jgi:transposase
MISLNQIRTAIRSKYYIPDLTIRAQGDLVGASHQTMMRINKRCDNSNINHPIAETLSDSELVQKLYPHNNCPVSYKRPPDTKEIVCELTKARGKRKTRTVLYLEYVAIEPATALSRTHFFRIINKVLKHCKLSMKQLHAAGDVIYIDYAGTKIYYMKAGEKVWVKVFVAVLGASKKLFAWATYGEKTQHWIDGMVRAFDYFGGVTNTVSMDNAKALVKKPGLIANLTDNVAAFGLHYDVIMDTCRIAHGQDKSDAEGGVRFTTQRILIPMMQNHTFFSLDEINQYLTKEVENLNSQSFQGLDISRNDLFERNEKAALKPLPLESYKMIVARLKQKVPPNYHIKYLKHEYSVPYSLHGEVVDVFVDQTCLRVVYDYHDVACHPINNEPLGASTLPEHMPAEHLADMKSNDMSLNLGWAKNVGLSVETIVAGWYDKLGNSTSRVLGKRCTALKKLSDKHGMQVLNDACEYADLHGMSAPSDISLIISAQYHEEGFESLPKFNPAHQNVRGAEYFGGRHEA